MTCAKILSLLVLATGCASDPASGSCEDRQSAANESILAALTEARKDLSCTVDADCVQIAVSSSCTDSCSANLNTAGAAVVQAAIDDVNAGVCGTFGADGCKLTIPPCEPPNPTTCQAGTCTL